MSVLCWNSIYHYNPLNKPAPKFSGSSKKTVNNEEFDCDRYIEDVYNVDGEMIHQRAFDLLYDASGNLKCAQKISLYKGKESVLTEILINVFTSEVPATAFEIQKQIKVYPADIGGMQDLLESPESIGEIGGKNR